MNEILIPFPCSITENINENLSNANVILFPSFYILNQVLRIHKVFFFFWEYTRKALLSSHTICCEFQGAHFLHLTSMKFRTCGFHNQPRGGGRCGCHQQSRCLQIKTCRVDFISLEESWRKWWKDSFKKCNFIDAVMAQKLMLWGKL